MNYDDKLKVFVKLPDPREQDQPIELEKRRQAYLSSLK
jgi:hypothetical protein